MPDTQAEVAVVNEALVGIGGAPIQTFADEVDGCDDIERIYRTIVGAQLAHPFSWSVKRVRMNKLAEAPADSAFANQFISPVKGDLQALYKDATTKTPFVNYRLFEGRVHADELVLYGEIRSGAHPDNWPEYFRLLIVTALQAELAFPVTGDRLLARDKRLTAYGPLGEDPHGGLVRAARQADGQKEAGGVLTLGQTYFDAARSRRSW